MYQLDNTTKRFFNHLWRNGAYSYYWTNQGQKSYWFETRNIDNPPAIENNIYFGVHPVAMIPQTNKDGEPKPPEYIRSQNSLISAVNCLFAEYDFKTWTKEDAIEKHVKSILPPSLIIFSGGGFHYYWLFDNPFIILMEQDRQRIESIQRRWVEFIGGDKGAKDLARILRVPGTRNYKPDYAPNFPLVEIKEADFNRLYSLTELETMLPEAQPVLQPAITPQPPPNGALSQFFTQEYAQKALDVAGQMIRQSTDGNKHTTLLKAAKLLGGYSAGNLISDDVAINLLEKEIAAKPNVESFKLAQQTIRDGIAYGKAHPITAEQILSDSLNWAARQNGHIAPKTEDEAKPIFTPWNWIEFLSRPPKQWFFKNFIGPADIVVLAGDSGSGKTVLVLDLAMCAIQGKQYASRFDITEPLKIAYCTAEGIGNLPSRIKAAKDKNNVPMATIESRFFGYDGPIIPQFFLAADSEYSIEGFEQDLQTLGIKPDILIVDTLALAAINGNLEDNNDMTKAMIRAREFTNRTNIAVLFTHHNNREGNFRGAASLRDNSDGLFVARYNKEKDERKLLCKDDKWGKLKDGDEWPGLLYTLESNIEYQAPVAKWLGDYTPREGDGPDFREELFDVLPMDEEWTGAEITEALKDMFTAGTIRNGLSRLYKKEELIRTLENPKEKPSKKNPYKYGRTIKSAV